MVKAQPYSFNELNGLVISEVLNLHQDEDKGVCLIIVGRRDDLGTSWSKNITHACWSYI